MGLIPSILLIFVFLFSCGDSVETRLIVEWNETDETGRVRYMILNQNRSWLPAMGKEVLPASGTDDGFESMNWRVDNTKVQFIST